MGIDKLLENKYLYGGLIIAIVIYVQSIKLNVGQNTTLSKILNSNLFRLVVLTLIAYISTRDMTVSIILGIGFIALLVVLKRNKVLENFKTNFPGIIDLNRKENKPLPQPGLINKLRCDPANPDTKFSFNTPMGCVPYGDETTEYKL
jgi:hypothetical protein